MLFLKAYLIFSLNLQAKTGGSNFQLNSISNKTNFILLLSTYFLY